MRISSARRLVIAVFAACVLAPALSTFATPPARQDQQPAPVVEQGRFVLHKFEQPIGEETYTVTNPGDRLAVKMDFKFTDRGTAVPLTASFTAQNDLTPDDFEIKGSTSRQSTIDDAVEIHSDGVRIRAGSAWTEAARPQQFFTIAGYAPATMQMLMVRYWSTHGSPAKLPTLPGGQVEIEPRGREQVTVAGKGETLSRFTVEGLIWGRETLWFDSNLRLVAAVTLDAEFDHFEAIREGYEDALGTFVGRAGADGMAALADISKTISGSHSDRLTLVGGTLIDGTGRQPVPDSAVVIENGRIVAAGPRSEVKIPKGSTVVDTTGKTILPGLWDMHAHFEQVEWGPIYLAAGATTVRDCGNEFEFITAVRDAIASGRGLGPRILAAGIVDGTGPIALSVQRVDTPEQARMWVHRYHDAGFQQMKVYSSVKLPELKAVTQEAHRLGMTVTGHIPEGLDMYQGVEAGMDQINHITYIMDVMIEPTPRGAKPEERMRALSQFDLNSSRSQRAIAFLKSHGTVLDPTLAIFEFNSLTTDKPPASVEPGVTKAPPELAAQLTNAPAPSLRSEYLQKRFEDELSLVGALHRAGIPIVAGTDQTVPGHSLHREIELYAEAGFTPMEAIQAATIVPARVMGLEKELGTVERGKRADLIILGGNPLESIHNIRKVEFVITNGTMYNCAELWRSVGFQP